MTARAPLPGAARLKARLAGLPAAARAGANAALTRMGADTLAAARAALAAFPGDKEGRLAASLTATLDPETSRLTVTATHPAAAFLEFGTRRAGARPFLRPAVAAVRDAALQHGREALAEAIRSLKEAP